MRCRSPLHLDPSQWCLVCNYDTVGVGNLAVSIAAAEGKKICINFKQLLGIITLVLKGGGGETVHADLSTSTKSTASGGHLLDKSNGVQQ